MARSSFLNGCGSGDYIALIPKQMLCIDPWQASRLSGISGGGGVPETFQEKEGTLPALVPVALLWVCHERQGLAWAFRLGHMKQCKIDRP